ncbi:GAA1 (YLR088W) [Zygosaccharomyces parabailii]|nr:GAA1 (YLR088W) [Zygosaccharomyces parabailii]
MALLEQLQRRMVEMGLVPKIVALLPVISLLCALVSTVWLAILPVEGQYRRTYISENALMPSQAYSYFRETEWNILRGYRSQIENFGDLTTAQRNRQMSQWLQEFGTKTSLYQSEEYGDSLYGILHSQRGDGTEAILLAIPWLNSENELNIGGASLGISLARYFSRWPVWSKNIIVVFSENPNAALRSWVQAYHTSLDLTGGSIEAAIVLDYPGANDYFEYVEISYDGLNGELPNLDLVNIAIFITEHEGMDVSLHGIIPDDIDDDSYWSRLRILARGVYRGAFSGLEQVSGNEAFSGWRIQSVTLKAHGSSGSNDITTFGRIPEAMFRSINNLLEKFHQSFFFYILVAPRYFVSISSYLPAAIVLSVGFAVASLNSLINNQYQNLSFFSPCSLIAVLIWLSSMLASFIVSQFFFYVPSTSFFILLTLMMCLIPLGGGRLWTIAEPLSHRLQCYAFLYMSLVTTSLMMVNFSLAFVVGLLAFPLTSVKSYKSFSLKSYVLLVLSHPFISIYLFGPRHELLRKLLDAWEELGCWTWFVLCLTWLPSWTLVALSANTSTKLDLAVTHKKNQ